MNNNSYISYPLEIIEIVSHTEIDRTFRLNSNMNLKSGQFLEISIPCFGEAPISVSDFGNGWLELTIRKVGRLTETIFELKVGDKIYARGPYGNGFDVSLLKNANLIIVAGGTGIAPVKSLISYFCVNRSSISGFDIVLGFKNPDSVLFKREIENWNRYAQVMLTVDHGTCNWKGLTGFVTKFIDEFRLHPGKTKAIIVGPPIMIKLSALGLVKLGVAEEDIYLSFERRMSCGIGKCGHCKIDNQYICVDGPVFTYNNAKRLLD